VIGKAKLKESNALNFLTKMVGDSNQKVNAGVLKCLINLSEDPIMQKSMLEMRIISRVLDDIGDSDNTSEIAELYAMLLVNATRTPQGVTTLLQVGEPLMGYYLQKMMQYFCSGTLNQIDWIASVFNNISQIPEGRKMLLEKPNKYLCKLFPFVEHESIVRRKGIISTIRNCLFEKEYHDWLFSDEVDILSVILMPIRGPEQFNEEDQKGMPEKLKRHDPNKKRDTDIECRRLLVDSITLLTATKLGRETLRANKVYPILREFDLREEDAEVHEKIYHLVHVLVCDEVESPKIEEIAEPESRRLADELDEEGEPIEEI